MSLYHEGVLREATALMGVPPPSACSPAGLQVQASRTRLEILRTNRKAVHLWGASPTRVTADVMPYLSWLDADVQLEVAANALDTSLPSIHRIVPAIRVVLLGGLPIATTPSC